MFEVLTAVKMLMLVLWVVTPCSLVGRYKLLLQGTSALKMRQYTHGFSTQKISICIAAYNFLH
jgi:hypothetical protein